MSRHVDPTTTQDTIWKSIPRFPNYIISEHGDIKRIAGRNPDPDRTLKTRPNAAGYAVVCISNAEVRGKQFLVHRLVCEAFHGPAPSAKQNLVLHYDDVRLNNHYTNLRWGSAAENSADARRNGKMSNNFSDDDIRYIRLCLQEGLTHKLIANYFNTTNTAISFIKSGTTWKHVS